MNEYLIIGNSAAATGAIEGIRTVDKKGEITVLSEEPHLCYSRPLISYFLAGKVDGEKLIYRGWDFYQRNNVKLYLGRKVIKLDSPKKIVEMEGNGEFSYKKLLIATGSSPLTPPVKGTGKKGQHFFYTLNDVYDLKENIKEGESAVIVGGGLIGLKAAEALSLKGLKVTVVERAPYLLSSILNQVSAAILEERIRNSGIRVIVNNTVE
ncbi:MAG: NAD(P)/FAD-dependent oxidoreductase, partial [Candidatus Syntrophonatronum acetioxidans]